MGLEQNVARGGVTPTQDKPPKQRGVAADSVNWRGAAIFFGPAAVLLLVFLVFPTI
jgi:hypothetical protein